MDTAKLFQNGKSLAVRLPKQFRLDGDQVYIKRMGQAIVLLPYHEPWQTLIESLDLFTDDFMEERTQLPMQIRKDMFE
ncbi:MAG: AbrB/MazE/SpoVT family DNA-binding domain-containing protein [Anaerolineales bacterium]